MGPVAEEEGFISIRVGKKIKRQELELVSGLHIEGERRRETEVETVVKNKNRALNHFRLITGVLGSRKSDLGGGICSLLGARLGNTLYIFSYNI